MLKLIQKDQGHPLLQAKLKPLTFACSASAECPLSTDPLSTSGWEEMTWLKALVTVSLQRYPGCAGNDG